jgi:uncharacterized 2Fe-2S/4Fe-4S cluster protein (DUF4445 family)
MSEQHQVCTGACLLGKCPFESCIKYKQGGSHRPLKANMSILTDGRLPKIPTGRSGYGVAVDIGTTTLALYLYDLEPGECVAVQSALNPQTSFGLDVISRIKYCRDNASGTSELQAAIVDGLNAQLEKLCAARSINPADVSTMSITGNTTMLHLLAGVNPSSMGEFPFDVPDMFGRRVSAASLGLAAGGDVYLERCVAAFVGGDITSAILSSGMMNDDVALLLDIGTNGEVALVAHGQLFVSSTAAGPAFEGSELSCGMAAVVGAVGSVWAQDGAIQTTVIGGGAPKGLCGSGVIDAIALMRTSGAMDETGRIEDGSYTVEIDGAPAFVVAEGISVTQRDVRRIQTAKAAIAAGVLALVHRAGLQLSDIQNVYLAGGFGNYMNAQSAMDIGLLPAIFRDIIKNIGNAAGAGAGMTLLFDEYMKESLRIAGLAEHVELGGDAYFMDQYVECMMF